MSSERKVAELLALAGIQINGPNQWDIQVKDSRLYSRVLAGGSLALGESYMDRWWECNKLDEFFTRIFRAKLDKKIKTFGMLLSALKAKIFNQQRTSKAFEIGEAHYDIGNDLYQKMLGRTMMYSCGYWKNAKTLDKAQEAKLDLICKKMGLKKGMKVLDIGCGWGGFAKFAAKKYKVSITGVTVSKEQAEFARETCKGLPVEIKLQDYRELNETFDRIISIGMFEHVGYKNYKTYMQTANRCLKEDGLFLLHTIGGNTSVHTTDSWINKYIFPNSMLPSAKQITEASEGIFVMEDWHNFGPDYDKTLMAWHSNFEKNWKTLAPQYGERFYRMWRYYLLACAGTFRARKSQLWQIVFSKGIKRYDSIR